MVDKLIALAILGGAGWYLYRQQQGTGGSDYQGAFGDTGIPWLPDMFDDKNPASVPGDGTLDWINDWSIFDMGTPRGIRNNNPGNIEYNGTQWQGLASPPSDGRFAIFKEPVYGIRALARVLETYYKSHELNTVRGIINRWAPPGENDSESYIANVAWKLGIEADQPFNVMARRADLVAAIIQHENGEQPYSDQLINRGVAMA